MSSGRRNETIPPKPLPAKGTIGITSPASPPDETQLERGIRYLEKLGYRVKAGKTCLSHEGYLAGSDELRASEFMSFIEDPDVDAIFCARGGFGSMRLFNRLDFRSIRKNRKLLVGFSDITALQWAIFRKTGLRSVSGGMVATDMAQEVIDPSFEAAFWNLIQSGRCRYPLPNSNDSGKTITGTLLPGTLSVAAKICGSVFFPKPHDSIFMLEDVHEPRHKIEGYLQQFVLCDIFRQCKSVITGTYIPPEKEDYDNIPELQTVFDRVFQDIKIPLITDFPYGHIPGKLAVPVGASVSLYLGQQNILESNGSIYTS